MQEDEKLLQELARLIEVSEKCERELVQDRVECVKLVYDAMCCSVSKKSNIKYEIGEPLSSMAVITIIGKPIAITNPELFARAISIADNFEVYPKTNGSVQMNLAFYNVARRVK